MTWSLESDSSGQFLPLWIAIHAIKEDSSVSPSSSFSFFLFHSLLHPSACLPVFLVFSCLAMNFKFFTRTKIKNLPTLVVIWVLYFSFPWGIILHLHLLKKKKKRTPLYNKSCLPAKYPKIFSSPLEGLFSFLVMIFVVFLRASTGFSTYL